jgi:hypothetical protein
MLTTIIGRGHGGTRAMSHTLTESGVYMGAQLNDSGDLVPPEELYEACRVMSRHVKYLGNMKWDFNSLHTMKIDPEFERLVMSFLDSVLQSDAPNRGWKLPETTLIYPWIVRMFPGIRYIFWVRDPRDSILGGHVTDDLSDFCIPYDPTENEQERRAISWKYQSDIYRATPAPSHLLELRFEDFVLKQDETLGKLEEYLGIPMAKIPVRPEAVGRWKTSEDEYDFPIFQDEIDKYGYERTNAVV